MVAHAYSPSYVGGSSGRMACAWEVKATVSCDHCTAVQPEPQSKTKKERKEREKERKRGKEGGREGRKGKERREGRKKRKKEKESL